MPDENPCTIKIGLRSDPFMDDPGGAESYYIALGRALVLWGRLESHLDYLLLALCNLKPCAPLRPKEMPVSMKRKTELLQTILKRVPELAPFRDPVLDLLPQIKDSAQDRRVIVHGHWNGFVEGKTLTCRFVVHRHKGEKLHIERYDVGLETLHKLARTFDTLNTQLLPITWNVCLLSNTLGPLATQAPMESHRAPRSPAM